LNDGSDISVSGNSVDFFLGSRVQILDNNTLDTEKRCFAVGLKCTVRDAPSLVHGDSISFEAVVETDGGVRSLTQNISLVVSIHGNSCDTMGSQDRSCRRG